MHRQRAGQAPSPLHIDTVPQTQMDQHLWTHCVQDQALPAWLLEFWPVQQYHLNPASRDTGVRTPGQPYLHSAQTSADRWAGPSHCEQWLEPPESLCPWAPRGCRAKCSLPRASLLPVVLQSPLTAEPAVRTPTTQGLLLHSWRRCGAISPPWVGSRACWSPEDTAYACGQC